MATTISASIGDASAEEGETLLFPVTLSAAATASIAIDWTASAGTAQADDYAPTTGTLTIESGASRGEIAVDAVDDDVAEPQESFTIAISTSSAAVTIATASATGTIIDDDAAPAGLALLDAIPAPGGTVDPSFGSVHLIHFSDGADQAVSYDGDCAQGTAVRRALRDMADASLVAVFDHAIACDLAPMRAYSVAASTRTGDGARRRAVLEFTTTGAAAQTGLQVLDSQRTTRDEVDELFLTYLQSVIEAELDDDDTATTLAELVEVIARDNWELLVEPEALYDALALRVAYPSRDPSGAPAMLTGLVAMPDVAGLPFERRSRVLVLSHSTASTPSSLALGDTWYMLARLLASRGYLVVAADNFGRGGTDGPETYLLANRTANNTLDLLAEVLADPAYAVFHEPGGRVEISLMGYSQGGHSAMALWRAVNAVATPNVVVREVFSGGAPHDLYRTMQGILAALDGACVEGDPWCRFVEAESHVAYALRLLDGMLAYTDVGLAATDLVADGGLADAFVTGWAQGDAAYDRLRALVQLNGFAGIVEPESFGDADTEVHLYHSPFDRLVPYANTEGLAALLAPHYDVVFHEDECAGFGYELLFATVPLVGAQHTVCGFAAAQDVMSELRLLEAGSAGTAAAPVVDPGAAE